jgi:hypothetical protein
MGAPLVGLCAEKWFGFSGAAATANCDSNSADGEVGRLLLLLLLLSIVVEPSFTDVQAAWCCAVPECNLMHTWQECMRTCGALRCCWHLCHSQLCSHTALC